MNKRILLFLAIAAFNQLYIEGSHVGKSRHKRRSSTDDIEFSTPDLTAIYSSDHGEKPLVAYKVTNKTEWVSIGCPIITRHANGMPNYILSAESIRIQIRMLDASQREVLATEARRKYPDVARPTISLIPLQRFACELRIVHNNKNYLLEGEVHQLQQFSLFLDMPYARGTEKREAFEARIQQNDPLVWKCMMLAKGQVQRSNTLRLESSRIQSALALGSIFGNGNEAYVSRNQLNEITQKVRSVINMEEIVEIGEEAFSDQFKNQVLNLAASEFQQVDIDEALSKISKFGANFDNRDLSPSEIKEELSKVLKIVNDSNKEHIQVTNDTKRAGTNSNNNSNTFNGGFSGFSVNVTASTTYAQSNLNKWKNSDLLINDQLREINSASHNDVQWERKGNTIVVKSINVAKLSRAALQSDKSFNAKKTIIRDTAYAHPIELYSNELGTPPSVDAIYQIQQNITALEASLTDLKDRSLKLITSSVSGIRHELHREKNDLETQLMQLRSSLYRRGPYVKSLSVTTECLERNNFGMETFGHSGRKNGHVGMKNLGCQYYGSEWYLKNIDWTNSPDTIVTNGITYDNYIHATFTCCKLVIRPNFQEVIPGSSASAVAGG